MMDWTLCIICQQDSAESLKCPLHTHNSDDKTEPYRDFLRNANRFKKLDRMPVEIEYDENVNANEFVEHEAKWHKSCHLKFSTSKLQRAVQKRKIEDAASSSKGQKRCQRSSGPVGKNLCIFCQREDGHIHEFRTLQADDNLRRMAIDLQEVGLLARIDGGDLVALEAKYHLACLTALRNRHRTFLTKKHKSSAIQREEQQNEARAFVELISHVENALENGTYCFKFAELRQLYESRLKHLGIQREVNKGRFKQKVREFFPQAHEHSDGKNCILVFQQGMQDMMKQAMKTDYEGDTLVLAKAAKIVRKDIVNSTGFKFDGSFPAGCQQKSVPTSLKLLINMLLNGPDLSNHNHEDSQKCLTISQTILFNCKKATSSASTSRHSLEHEPPLPLYLGLNIHTQFRSKKLITQLYNLGISVSYRRILQIESQLAAAVCRQAQEDGVVCPSQLRRGLFTVGAADNIDHNPSSTTATGSFHGTGISMFQYPTTSNAGVSRSKPSIQSSDTKEKLVLPDSFTVVPAVEMKPTTVAVPKPPCTFKSIDGHLQEAVAQEKCWLEDGSKKIQKPSLEDGDTVSWSAFHASRQVESNVKPALTQLLPLFYEKAATIAMIKHGMNVHRQATKLLNPTQIPVITMDAPLYALAKKIQWKWPQTHGEDKYTVILGGLHTEMALWNTLGDYLEGSGWTSALTQAGIATTGTADSFLRSTHLTRTRHAHQVTALALGKLQEDAFLQTGESHTKTAKDIWRQEMRSKSPTFQFWDTVLEAEILVLAFVRAHREANFSLYVESLKALVPWFFALDHQNYARWVPVHIRDMESLPETILKEFVENGHWVVPKTSNRFSSIPIDQAHEQNNETVKGPGGAVGLTENPTAFRKWMVAGPEQARLVTEFEEEYMSSPAPQMLHHEEGLSTQRNFKQQTLSLVETINEMGNPFLDDKPELLTLDSRDIMDDSVVFTVRNLHRIGAQQYEEYNTSVLVNRTTSIHEPIKRNSLKLFKSPSSKRKTKRMEQISMLKADVSLFSQLYIVMHHRGANMDHFFMHENHPYPPSLSDRGKLHLAKKADLLQCLECDSETVPPSSFDVQVLDGAAVVHFLPTTNVGTFREYAANVFVSHIKRLLKTSKRVDVVWDTYLASSIKGSTREKRGKGTRRRVSAQTKIPGNWQDFLRDPINKQELFNFLSETVAEADFPPDKEVFITCGPRVLARGTDHEMPLCNHEEADTRLFSHLKDALETGSSTCLVRTVDTDVIVIILGEFHHLLSACPEADVWVAFGTGKSFTHHHINEIYHALGKDKSLALPLFHSFTGCDTASGFFGKGKRLAWQAWKCFPEVTEAFTYFALHPYSKVDLEDEKFKLIERFTVVLYDKTSQQSSVNSARKEMFCQKARAMEKIPPTQDALLQHLKRAVYQAGIWSTSHESQQEQPIPQAWGWTLEKESQSWIPVWNTLPTASKACNELVKCSCKSARGCSGKCACKKAGWRCTELCSCQCEK